MLEMPDHFSKTGLSTGANFQREITANIMNMLLYILKVPNI